MSSLSDHANKKAARPKSDIEIFVDMDGVLTDFDSHARAQGKYHDDGRVNWDAIGYGWWVSMPAFDGAKKFYEDLKAHGNVRILTSPALSADCYRGKAEWVERFWPERGKFALRDLIICPSTKRFMAKLNHILIDDRQTNIDEWTAAGGIGILHTGDFADTLKRVKQAVDSFRAQKKSSGPKPAVP